MSFDPKCLELAQHFLADVPPEAVGPQRADELAQLIQDTVEMYISTDLGVE